MHLPFAMYMYLVYITFQTKTPNPELCVQHEQIKIININKETFVCDCKHDHACMKGFFDTHYL